MIFRTIWSLHVGSAVCQISLTCSGNAIESGNRIVNSRRFVISPSSFRYSERGMIRVNVSWLASKFVSQVEFFWCVVDWSKQMLPVIRPKEELLNCRYSSGNICPFVLLPKPRVRYFLRSDRFEFLAKHDITTPLGLQKNFPQNMYGQFVLFWRCPRVHIWAISTSIGASYGKTFFSDAVTLEIDVKYHIILRRTTDFLTALVMPYTLQSPVPIMIYLLFFSCVWGVGEHLCAFEMMSAFFR